MEDGGEVLPETRHWNDAKGVTTASRAKAFSRKFMPDPDLPPLVVTPEWLKEARASLPEMPENKVQRYVNDMGLSEADAAVLTDSIDVAMYFEACVAAGANPTRAGTWVRTEVLRAVNEKRCCADDLAVKPASLAGLISRIDDGRLSTTLAKSVFEEMLSGLSIDEALNKSGAAEGGVGADELDGLVRAVLEANPDVVDEIKLGKDTKGKKVKFLHGLVMKESKGQARSDEVAAIIEFVLK
jgi:aspartyl-tRNA(Asn)/glutamyl-tRNA(Gln) amidotransferase subunit B